VALRVLHLVGSAESEFYAELSRLYAADCLRANEDPERYRPVIAYVSPDGDWRFPTDLTDAAIEAAEVHAPGAAIRILEVLDIDVAVPQMFCIPGMTWYRGLLDLLGIPYVGNRPEVMAATADKAWARAIVGAAGVDVPAGEVVGPGRTPVPRLPAVVKPTDADNSLGVSLVREPGELPGALALAREHSEEVLVEDYVELGREVRCGLLEADGRLVPLPLEEYPLDAERPIRRAADKIRRDGEGGLALVAKGEPHARAVPRDDPATGPVWEAAKRAHVALGCRHYSLFDFRIDPDGRPWFLEAGLYNSFARQSVIPTMAAAAGIPHQDLLSGAIREVLAGSVSPAVEPLR
jgi:D-alanine-D-alanine ligase